MPCFVGFHKANQRLFLRLNMERRSEMLLQRLIMTNSNHDRPPEQIKLPTRASQEQWDIIEIDERKKRETPK